jgi:hypothetical protein
MSIDQPAQNAALCPPVPAVVSWSTSVALDPATFNASLDGNQLPPGTFTIDNTISRATASLPVSPGSHVLVVSGTLSTFFGAFGNNDSESVTFSGTPPTLAFSNSTSSVTAGNSVTIVGSANCGTPPSSVTLTPSSNIVQLGSQPAGAADMAPVQNGQFTEQVIGLTGGSATVIANASGFQNGSSRFDVAPVLTGANPGQATVGTTVALSGNGFAPGATADVAGRTVPLGFINSTQLSMTVPQPAQQPPANNRRGDCSRTTQQHAAVRGAEAASGPKPDRVSKQRFRGREL